MNWFIRVTSVGAALLLQLPVAAGMKQSVGEDYLHREFAWMISLDTMAVGHYLNYQGSRLNPLHKIRVSTAVHSGKQQTWQEFWYYKSRPVGLRRVRELAIPQGMNGVIVVRASNNENSEQCDGEANVIVRLLLDLYLKKSPPSTLIVPQESYERIAGDLSRYGFSENSNLSSLHGAQLGIQLRSFPYSRSMDKQLFFRK